MTGWGEYSLAMALFIGSHFVPRIGGLRDRLITALGQRIYFSVYGMMSLALLVWVVIAAGRAPYMELWPQMPWTRCVPNIVMPAAIILATCGVGIAQPFTLGGRRRVTFDAVAPGFAAVSRHPLFLALALWSGAHLVPNGDLAHVILFGSFAAMALAAIPAFDAKARRALGPQAAQRFMHATAILSLAPLFDPNWRRLNGRSITLRAIAGLVLWLALLHLHEYVIGVSPFPV
ncbi:NnrU family protein [Pseudohalocynthiibacter aestuariivivens]|nr:NnrU family protein [Pseudohalocynthiibacter aestuariivivens]QIE44981.1 NnrU family protein [Pseudohalocynthiibacter aestuariivivens]